MNKNKKWLLALSVAGLIAANGIAMAAVSNQQDELQGQRPAFTHKGEMKQNGMKEHKKDHTALLALLNTDDETFKAEMKAGKTLIEIAKEHGVSEQALKDFMVQQMNARIEEGVTAGKISADKAEKMKANMDERVTNMLNGKHTHDDKGKMHKKGGEMGKRGMFNDAELLALLNIDAETLKTEMQAGKTLVAIAKEHGVSEQDLKDTLIAKMTKHLEEGVADGKIPADKAEQMKADMDQHITNMINGKAPMNGGKRMMHKDEKMDCQATDNQ